MRNSIVTIVAMIALSYTTRCHRGMDAILGLAFANTGVLYPFFGTLIGWIRVALTGTDAGSNALFGSQQQITANKLGISPTLMAAANSSGGVMGKMIDAQSIVVASVATNYVGKEGVILRYVFWHSIALACLIGLFVMLQAYVPPFTSMVIEPGSGGSGGAPVAFRRSPKQNGTPEGVPFCLARRMPSAATCVQSYSVVNGRLEHQIIVSTQVIVDGFDGGVLGRGLSEILLELDRSGT